MLTTEVKKKKGVENLKPVIKTNSYNLGIRDLLSIHPIKNVINQQMTTNK
jgi:hypothetical protein